MSYFDSNLPYNTLTIFCNENTHIYETSPCFSFLKIQVIGEKADKSLRQNCPLFYDWYLEGTHTVQILHVSNVTIHVHEQPYLFSKYAILNGLVLSNCHFVKGQQIAKSSESLQNLHFSKSLSKKLRYLKIENCLKAFLIKYEPSDSIC